MFSRTDTFMINADDVTTLDSVGEDLPAPLAQPSGGALNRYAYDQHILNMAPITPVESAAYAAIYTDMPRHQWVLEQRRLKGLHGQDVVNIRTERGVTTLATGKTGTRLPDQISLLVDLGRNINISGLKEARKLMELHSSTVTRSR